MRLKDKCGCYRRGSRHRPHGAHDGARGRQVVVADLQGEKAQSVANDFKHWRGIDRHRRQRRQRIFRAADGQGGLRAIRPRRYSRLIPASISEKSVVDLNEKIGTDHRHQPWQQFLCCRALSRHARTEKRPVISVASGIGTTACGNFSLRGLESGDHCFVKSLAREVGPDGITVNAICPGSANTAMPRQHRSEEEVLERLRATPLPHILEPEDIAGSITFLASDAAKFITGQSYNINSGSYMF